MYLFLISFHMVLCALLVLIILMQPGKGADVSSAFGGGASSQLFGAAGPGNFLTRGTGLIALLFMVTSVSLALYTRNEVQRGGDAADAVKDVEGEGAEGEGFGVTAPGGSSSSAPGDGAGGQAPAPPPPAAPSAPVPAGGAAAPAPAAPAPTGGAAAPAPAGAPASGTP